MRMKRQFWYDLAAGLFVLLIVAIGISAGVAEMAAPEPVLQRVTLDKEHGWLRIRHEGGGTWLIRQSAINAAHEPADKKGRTRIVVPGQAIETRIPLAELIKAIE